MTDPRTAGEMPEGEESAPPGVRAMSLVRWGLVALVAVAAAGTWLHASGIASRAPAAAAAFQCPMHPSVLQDRRGECPICGMDLVPVEPGKPRPAAAAAAAGPGKYWCPMHPEVWSDDPEARCEKCGGMKLVPRQAPAAGVAGLVPVDIGAERVQLMGIRVARVARENLAPQLRTVGFVSANESTLAIVTARFTGWIEELRATQSGQRVEKGQVLATVYSPELTTAQQVYANALRWSRDPGSGAPPTGGVGANLDQDARRRLELLGMAPQDIAEVARTGKPLAQVPIRSPVGGYVARRGALPGLYFTPGAELFQIADLSSVWVIADVYEYDMSRVKVGQRANLRLGAYPGERFAGRVQFIYPAVNPESRTLQARAEFRNPGLRLRPGMYGDVIIELEPAHALAIPTEAIVDTGELQYVFLSRPGGRFEPRQVRLGARTEGKVEVLEGLAEGDAVVTTANFLVDSESRLRAAVEGFTPAAAAPAGEGEPGKTAPVPSR